MNRQPLIQLPASLTDPPGNPAARYAMGVDGGATKTLAAVMDLQDGVLHLGHGGSSNPDAVGTEAAGGALMLACGQAAERMGIALGDLDGAVLAMAGTDTDAIRALVDPSGPLAQAGGWSHARAPWVVVNDVVGAWAAATHARPGVGAIAGTGSNVLAVGPDGRAWRAGGWGHVLGDEGSGYWLGVHSIRAALGERDGSGPPTALGEAALRFFGAPSIEALASLVYSKPMSKGELAAFAAETSKAAHAGDAVALALYDQAAAELGAQIVAAIRETGLRGSFPVGLIGGAFHAGSVYVDPLTAAIHARAPGAQVSVVATAPVAGCLLLAARAAGRELAGGRLEPLLAQALLAEAG